MKNLVVFGACKEESSESSDSDVDTNEEEYHVLLNKWLNLKNDNLRLQQDLVQSREQNEELAEELATVNEKNESLEQEVSKMREVSTGEQERERMLERIMTENHKRVRILNGETKDLDKILSI